ncbi:MAG: spore germination protein, partial [Clostridia bacterium]|nr:spore germination protein [Clostridia bacterium]
MRLKDLFIYKSDRVYKDFTIAPPKKEEYNNAVNSYIKNDIKDKNTLPYKEGKVSESLSENLEFIKDAFCVGKNFDLVIREFSIPCIDGERNGFLFFYDGMSNKEFINRDILGALLKNGQDITKEEITEETIYKSIISQAPLSKSTKMATVIELVGFGNCGIFIDGIGVAFISDVKGWSGRSVGQPVTEAVLTGPQEAFTEQVMTNISLIRKILKDSNLISENIKIGSKSQTPCALMYLNGITNSSLVDEVRKRLSGIDTEYIFSSSEVEMFIEESTLFPLPQVLKTERPDRAASYLSQGKVVVIVQGSPFALVLPATMPDLVETAEDNYVRVGEANFMRLIRIFGILISLLLPGTFVAISLYHHESIPTDLLFAIEATREIVPFPVITELLLMELAFELIK